MNSVGKTFMNSVVKPMMNSVGKNYRELCGENNCYEFCGESTIINYVGKSIMNSLGEINYKFCEKRILMNSVMGKESLRILWRRNHYKLYAERTLLNPVGKNHYRVCGKESLVIMWERATNLVGKNHYKLCGKERYICGKEPL